MTDREERIKESLEDLETLRDEIRVKLHLAASDAKTAWEDLETRFTDIEQRVEREGREVSSAATDLVSDLKKAFQDFRDRLAH